MAKEKVPVPPGFESGVFEHDTPVGVLVRRVLRRGGPGPAVILLHEAPGLSASTFGIADRLSELGFTVVVPELLDAPTSGFATVVRICIARELGGLSRGETGAIVTWIRGLAAQESEAAGGRTVGVVGMCLSGGFALATAIEPRVRAVVASQPALPFNALSDLGMSRSDLDTVRDNVEAGTCVRALRFRADARSPGPRLRRLAREIPTAETVVIPSWNPSRHSVLAEGLRAPAGSPLAEAFEGTLAFLEKALGWHRGQGGRPA